MRKEEKQMEVVSAHHTLKQKTLWQPGLLDCNATQQLSSYETTKMLKSFDIYVVT